ncbi:signal transduction histidine kinase regulating citrate/malate metabolism [Alkaliphilus metalliredigens QYMF]|uniref:Signal transduction histidine kinase regulating citrate/malate metabolism n=1 Tax=Alkaliphilus metalliredigens (strain QYMF) TaxID=293826 RepID=A6TU21_ALKMQ|nr:GHKL domain-containing protein [Alkaliphilus metalliredigens]ABR49689.1 signal transduction histidine kinase regulating citrate/malate metabolism [Alkaliphilus metalliredigens QYMF]
MIIEFIKMTPVAFLITSTFLVIFCQLSISWKDNKKKIIFAIFTVGLLPLILSMHGYPYRMILSHINDIIWFKFLFGKKFKDIVVLFYTAFVFFILVDIPISILFIHFLAIETASIPYIAFILIHTTSFVVISILCWILPIRKFYIQYKFTLERYFPILLVFILNIYFLNSLMYSYDFMDAIPAFMIALLTAIIIFSFLQVMVEDREEKILIRSYEQQKSLVLPLIEEIRSKQHDFKNHITTIYGFSQQSNSNISQNIQTYIENLNKHLKDVDIFFHIENNVISGILYSKLCEAESRYIDLHYEIPPYEIPFPLTDYEYVAILGNVFDNAFEAPMKSEDKMKRIIFKLIDDGNSSVLEIWNNGTPINSKDMSDLFRKGYSTKKNKSQRGYGLYNVKRIVDKYNGNIEILTQNNLTGFRICFPSN